MIRGLWKLPGGRDWLRGKLDVVLLVGAMLGKLLIQISVDGWSCVLSLLFAAAAKSLQSCPTLCDSIDGSPPGSPIPGILPAIYLGPNYGGGNEENGDLPQNIPGMYCHSPRPQPCSRPTLTQAVPRDSPTPTDMSSMGSVFISLESWYTRFCCALWVYFPVLCKFCLL